MDTLNGANEMLQDSSVLGGLPLLSPVTAHLTVFTALAGVTTFLSYAYYHQYVAFKQLRSLPGPRDFLHIPFSGAIGVGFDLLKRLLIKGDPLDTMMHNFLCRMSDMHRNAGLFHIDRLFTPLTFVFRADHVEKVLNHSVNIRKGALYQTFIPWLRRGLLTSDGDKWKARRRQLNPVFHFRSLDNYNAMINEQAARFKTVLAARTSDKDADIVPYVNKLSLDLISSTILGVPMDALLGTDGAEYLQSVADFSKLILSRGAFPHEWNMATFKMLPKARQHDELLKKLWGFTAGIIEKRKEIIKEQMAANGGRLPELPGKYRPLLDILLELHVQDPSSMTMLNIQEEVDTFTFSGHDTTALGLMFSLFLIGCYPEVQQRIQQEIDMVFADDPDAPITAERLKDLKYLDITIKECHRVLPPVALIGRELDEEMEFNGKVVPKGTNVFLHIFSLHRDPEVFPEPEKFDPDRFLPENAAGRNPFSFVPFSAGPRSCIGQRYAQMVEKVVIVNILKTHNLKSLERLQDLQLVQDIVLHSKHGLKTMIEPRKVEA